MVLVLEDLHWGDALTVDLVSTAISALPDQPFRVLGFARPEVTESFPVLGVAGRRRTPHRRSAGAIVRAMGWDELITPRWTYGRIDEHDGEYVETEFRGLGGLRIPLVPVRSFWIADDRGHQRTGFPIELQPRSVAAAYLRIWAPGIATAVLVAWSSSLATAIAAALFGLSAWSWTWWPRDAALRRRSDFDLAAFGSRCDPARMTDEMHQALANQLAQRAGAHADARPPDDVARYGPRTEDEALHAYGALRLTEARNPPQRSPGRLFEAGGAGWMLSRVVRRRRSRGGPYRDRFAASAPALWAMLSDCAQASVRARRAGPLRSHAAVPAPALVLPSSPRAPWIWLAVLTVSTVVSGTALAVSARAPAPAPPALPRLVTGRELALRPIGDHIAVQCDYVQNSDRGPLRRVTLCLVSSHILAMAGGDRVRDGAGLLEGYVEEVPDGPEPSWASALRQQIAADPTYYDFYLRRVSSGDGPELRSAARAGADRTPEAVIRALAVAASLATLAGWFVWIRLWQLRRRVAAWSVTG